MRTCPSLYGCLILAAASLLPSAAGQEKPLLKDPAPLAKPEPKQLQFWVGDWDVADKDKRIGTSSIQWVADEHAILESYSQPGFSGKSLTFVDRVLGKWRQTWVDSQGRVSEFVGEYRDGAMRFEGETHSPDGSTVRRRMVLQPLESARLRHSSERSLDNGKTWVMSYDYTYTKKK